MIWTIAAKEFLEKIQDFRVIVSFVLAVVFTLVVAYVVGEDYKASKESYDQEVAAAETDYRAIKVFSDFSRRVVYPPSPLAVLSRGSELPASLSVVVSPTKVPRFEPSASASKVFMSMFDTLDLVTVFRILFALLVILLTYDSFSGEKESGTLRLVMSTSVSRMEAFFGKFLGVFLVVSAVTTLTYALAIMSVRWVSGIGFGGPDYARGAFALLSTLLYLLVFTVFGICSSILFRQSSTSLVGSLLVWFVIAIVQPNLNSFVSTEMTTIPRLRDVEPALRQKEEELNDKADLLDKATGLPSTTTRMYGSSITNLTDADYDILQIAVKRAELQREFVSAADGNWELYKELYLASLEKQASIKKVLDFFAPSAILTRCVSVLSHTDVENYESFLEGARRYRHQCVEYLDRKGIYTANPQRFFSRLTKSEIDPREAAERMERYKKDPFTIPWIDRQEPIDLSDAPSYQVAESPLSSDLLRVSLELGLMLLYALLITMVALRSLNKYDVR